MNRQKIRNAYEHIHPDAGVKERILENILSAASGSPPVQEGQAMKKIRLRRMVCIAAVVCAIVMLSVVGYANDLFGLQDLVIPIKTIEGEADGIAYQGLSDSNAVKGSLEWQAFLESFDPHYEIYDRVKDTCAEDYGAYYYSYGCYTQEMVDKLEEICEKYSLTLHGNCTMVQKWEGGEKIYQSAGIETIFADCGAENEPFSGYYYEDGSFHFDGETVLNREEFPWKRAIRYQFCRVIKNSLDTVHLNIGDMESYTQWNYITQDGTKVLLAIGPDKGLVIANLEESIVNINVLNVDDSYGELSQRSLEAFADTFAFSNIP